MKRYYIESIIGKIAKMSADYPSALKEGISCRFCCVLLKRSEEIPRIV